MKRSSYLIKNFLSFLIIAAAWEVLSVSVNNQLLVPSLGNIFRAFIEIFTDKNSFIIIFSTISRGVSAFLISLFLGSFAAVLAWKFKLISSLILAGINLFKRVPTIGIIIIALIWFDVAAAPLMIGLAITLPLIFEAVTGGIESISRDFILMTKIYSPSSWEAFKFLYIPSVFFYVTPLLPSIIGLTFKTVIAGEVLAQLTNSIGGEIFLEKIYLNTSKVFAWIIIVLFFNWILETLLRKINLYCRKLCLVI